MRLTFFGAAKAVTGSCHCMECNGKKILVDCGLQQGRDERDNRELDFNAGYIDAVIVTHAHIDHSGRIPLLVKQGFEGNIYCTRLTGQLLSIMLRDSAHIQESDAQWQNQKGKRAGREPVEPLYTVADAEEAVKHLVTCEYGDILEIEPGVKVRFTDAGHLLGSASAEVWLTEGDETRKIVFSGDIGNRDQPIIRDPQYIQEADYVLTESTYGDRNHDVSEAPDYTADLAAIIDETLGQGGNVVIPSFAVGRTQELLYFMREMKEEGMVRSVPNFQVYVDSPLAGEATRIFSGDLHGYLDEEAIEALKGGALFRFPGLNITETSEESKNLNLDPSPKVIISASGMCDAGRIRHHLKHNLWRKECTVVFVGYQGEGTLGRRLLDGVKSVKLFGEEIAVQARIVNFHGLSSHADRDGLLRWISAFTSKPKEVFVVHGEKEVTEIYAQTLRERGFSAHSANYEEVYDLLAGRIVAPGIVLESKPTRVADSASPAYKRLEENGRRLLEVIAHNRGGANKDLAKFADQLKALIDKWDR
ncbi:MBL fold hydrolase [Flavonifractor sp. An92]|uniref:MBL fold metallo-hydrolase RNA specificity domain-containing protein n=1 Tax=Flavonifractor sp. An92 TaxID=1965666 RepID=UPI000B3A98DF|nr:MBL fold metallo-hydrolase [Flavonifractor sp. An92]OUN06174.1 MBL fold hydrolase [Flavonifractor sp. An92]